MLNFIAELFTILNAATPIAVIALLGVIIYVLVWRGGGLGKIKKDQEILAANHLHEIQGCLERIEKGVQGIELNINQTRHEIVKQQSDIQMALTWLQAKTNGHSTP